MHWLSGERESSGHVKWDRVVYIGRGLGTGVNRVCSKSSNLRRALSRAAPSNWMASRVKLTTGSWVFHPRSVKYKQESQKAISYQFIGDLDGLYGAYCQHEYG
jgi:hypothetical protein